MEERGEDYYPHPLSNLLLLTIGINCFCLAKILQVLIEEGSNVSVDDRGEEEGEGN
jgi:hypothetical protein